MHAQQQLRSLAVALALGVGLLAAPVQAQTGNAYYPPRPPSPPPAPTPSPVKDHLNCYEVERAYSHYPETKSVWIKTNYSRDYCKVEVQPDLFCTGASKTPDHAYGRFGGDAVGDFLCHEITYCNTQGGKGKEITVSDQFGFGRDSFKLKLKNAELLCAPAEVRSKY